MLLRVLHEIIQQPIAGNAPKISAAVILGKQRKDGTLDTAAPADAAITAIQETVDNVNVATSELDRLKQAASDVFGSVPVVGPLAQAAIDAVKLPRL